MRKREGIEPRNGETVGADLVNNREGDINGSPEFPTLP